MIYLNDDQESALFSVIAKSGELRAAVIVATRAFPGGLVPGLQTGQARALCLQLDQMQRQIVARTGRRRGGSSVPPSGVVTPDEGNTCVTFNIDANRPFPPANGRNSALSGAPYLPDGHIWP